MFELHFSWLLPRHLILIWFHSTVGIYSEICLASHSQAHCTQITQDILCQTLPIRGGSAMDVLYSAMNSLQGRIRLPSEEKVREGDWSVVLQSAMFSDSDMYECILEGRKTLSTVWLTVTGEWGGRGRWSSGDVICKTKYTLNCLLRLCSVVTKRLD